MTTTIAPAPVSYVSTAFYWQYNLILLGGAALFSLASASPWPLVFGLSAELAWLALGSRLGAFRRWVDQRTESQRRARSDDEVLSALRGLAPDHAARLTTVGQTISAISSRALSSSSDAGLIVAIAELEQLRPLFLRFCQLHQRLSQRLEDLSLAPPEQEVEKLSLAYAAEKDLGARYTLHQSIKLAQKRLEQQGRMTDMRRSLEHKLVLIEQMLGHLYNQQQLGTTSAELAHEVHGLVAQVGMTTTLEAELHEVGALTTPPPHVAQSVAPSR